MKTVQSCRRGTLAATRAINRYFTSSSPSTTAAGTTDYFGYEGQSEFYRLYRPKYPLTLLQELNNKLPIERSKRSLAVDIACGSGQLTQTLSMPLNLNASSAAEYGFGFKKVVGLDTSQSQLDKAMEHSPASNIEYRLEDIESSLSFADDSVDLVTIAQGLHWFDIPKLLKETKRIMKPQDGMFAVLGYSTPRFEQYEKFQEEFGKFYVHTLGSYDYGVEGKKCYWNIDRKLLDFAFEDQAMFVGEELFKEGTFERVFFFEHMWWNEQQLFGYFQSMSGYRTYLKENGLEHGDDGDPMSYLRGVYREDMQKYGQEKMLVIFPFFLLTMKK